MEILRVNPAVAACGGEAVPSRHAEEGSTDQGLLERVLKRENLQAALQRVKRNAGSAGVDGMTVAQLPGFLTRQLRLPAGTAGTGCGAQGARLCAGWISDRGGCGPGEVLRPGQPRHPDGSGQTSCDRRAGAAAGARLSERRDHGAWTGLRTA